MARTFVQAVVIVVPRASALLTLLDFLFVMPLLKVLFPLVKHDYLIAQRSWAFNLLKLTSFQMLLIIFQENIRFFTRLVNAPKLCVVNFLIEFVA